MTRSTEVVSEARSGDSYDAHSYHTKVPPRAIARLIAEHAPRGGTIGDAYCGSGTTGVAAALAETAHGSATYDVVLGDLSPYAAFIASSLNSPPPADLFEREAADLFQATREIAGDYWMTNHVDGRRGEILYTIWSEVLICPSCARPLRYWDAAVDQEQGAIRRGLTCSCGHTFRKADASRLTERHFDPLLAESIERTVREPVLIAYEANGRRHRKAPDRADLERIAALDAISAPASCPRARMLHTDGPWGDLYRAGYHQGVTHVHHFYTWRNLLTVGHLWDAAAASALPDHLRFLVSSYNLAHATLMSRVVFKRDSTAPVLTGYQTGTLYISSLPVEKNPLLGIERSKAGAVSRAFAITRQRRGSVRVMTAPASAWGEIPEQFDYVFVDPPFGANIPYAEANFIAEAWLGEFMDQDREASMSKHRNKSASDYRLALAEGFSAFGSRLRPGAVMTVMFHSADSAPWTALTGALEDAGFRTEGVQLLDKRQGSFKQVRSSIAVEGDVLIHVRRAAGPISFSAGVGIVHSPPNAEEWIAERLPPASMPLKVVDERELFSRYAAACVELGYSTDLSADEFYRLLRELTQRAATEAAAA